MSNSRRYKLLAFLGMSESKLAQWTVKYGHQDEVEELLTDYINVVERQRLMESVDTTLTQTKSVAEKYKMGGSGRKILGKKRKIMLLVDD